MLDHLPQELLSLIALYLDRGDLHRLVITSRPLCNAFQRSLYKDVSLRIETNNRHIMSAFFYAVTRSPQLASYVHSLNLRCWFVRTVYLDEFSKKSAFDAALVRELVSQRKGYSEKQRSSWLRDLKKDDIDAWAALLIPQMKELRKLSFSWPYGAHHLHDMLRNMHLEDEPLPHLREVYVSASRSINGVQSHYLDAFFKLPSVQKIGCFDISDISPRVFGEIEADPMEEGYLPGCSLEPRSSNITNIDLVSSYTPWGMREWIRACRQLRTFKITQSAGVIQDQPVESQQRDFRRIYRSLTIHQSTLECLWIDVSTTMTRAGFIGSFKDFASLRFLHAPLYMLTGLGEQDIPLRKLQDVLPSSLQTLQVFECHRNALEGIQLLVKLAASKTTSELKTIYFECPNILRATPEASMEITAGLDRLKGVCHESGISFFDDRVVTEFSDKKGPGVEVLEMSPGVDWPFNEALDPKWL